MRFESFTVEAAAALIGGTVQGDKSKVLSGIKPLAQAGPQDLSFFAPTGKRNYAMMYEQAKSNQAGCVLVTKFDPAIPGEQIQCPHPLGAIVQLSKRFFEAPKQPTGIHPTAVISKTAKIPDTVSIGAYVVIGENVSIGEHSTIYPHAVIYDWANIGAHCTIHAGAILREFVELGDHCVLQNGVVLGGDGFGYFPDKEIGHRHIPHVGTTVLEKGVDIGANTTIDRGMLGDTRIRENAKIDNLVMIGHNTQVGERTLICGHTGISGSCNIGNDVIIGGGTGMADHITVGDNVRVAGKTGVCIDVPSNSETAGFPNFDAQSWRRQASLLRKLPRLFEDVRNLKRRAGANPNLLSEEGDDSSKEEEAIITKGN